MASWAPPVQAIDCPRNRVNSSQGRRCKPHFPACWRQRGFAQEASLVLDFPPTVVEMRCRLLAACVLLGGTGPEVAGSAPTRHSKV